MQSESCQQNPAEKKAGQIELDILFLTNPDLSRTEKFEFFLAQTNSEE